MRKKLSQKRNHGFTLVETLVAAGILAVLLAISAVGVVRARALLKITELDNAARSIYMAAENQAVLLKNGKRLNSLVVKTGTNDNSIQAEAGVAGVAEGADPVSQVKLYYIPKADAAMPQLLPQGSIDPALWDGDFVVFYEPVSGCVTDVFYAEKGIDTITDEEMGQAFYSRWTTAGRTERMEPMLGYYGGGQAEGKENGPASAPYIDVEIENGERLTVKVTYWLPKSIGAGDYMLDVKLAYPDKPELVLTGDAYDHRLTSGGSGSTYTMTWVLDELGDRRFAGLFTNMAPGKNFTVTGILAPTGDKFDAVSDSDTDNSLFAEKSGDGNTAYITCLRHLQNLDQGYSEVIGKTQAVQEKDIFCHNNEIYPGYNFTPITNDQLTGYNGNKMEIRELYVSGAGKASGLFSGVKGIPANEQDPDSNKWTKANPFTFTGVRLVNAEIHGDGYSAGALAGNGSIVSIGDCWVYWEAGETDLRSLLGSNEEGVGYQYKVTGATAGGLVGKLNGGTIQNSLAATTIQGTQLAGGLVGTTGGAVTIEKSYADCYLAGPNAAGLVAQLNDPLTLTNCYAAGFIVGESTKAAGLCLGSGTTTSENVYTVVHYEGKTKTYYPLTEKGKGDSLTNTYYRGASVETLPDDYCKTYQDMIANAFVTNMGTNFAEKNNTNSHPYNLRVNQELTYYVFPGLASLPHYGDWQGEPKVPSLVYYEQYADDSYGFAGGNIWHLDNSKTILSDGYAILIHQDKMPGSGHITFTLRYFDAKNGELQKKDITYYQADKSTEDAKNLIELKLESETYYLAILPKWSKTTGEVETPEKLPDLQNGSFTSENIYQYLRFVCSMDDDSADEEYFYNPHFAETVIPYRDDEASADDRNGRTFAWAEEQAAGLMKNRSILYLRTPRHLYNLSQFPDYYHNGKHRVTYLQRLDIDYVGYTGYGLFPEPAKAGEEQKLFNQQPPIGDKDNLFNGIYNGNCHTIKNVSFQANVERQYAGLFGVSEGTLRNIVYEMKPDQPVTVAMGNGSYDLFIGGLVGGNFGVVENCAVSGVNLVGKSYGATIYVGGLVGQNKGVIRNCGAETASLSADCNTFANAYVGGFVGRNEKQGNIRTSYSVGRVTATVDAHSKARICGFAGYNQGRLFNSYAAQDLRSSGLNVLTYGFCGITDGNQSGTAYLNKGNFTYRERSYTAGYTPYKAAEKTYDELTQKTAQGNSATISGMKFVTGTDVFPYPTGVTDGSGQPAHHGKYPIPMDLGEMGVYYWEKLERPEAEDTQDNPDAPENAPQVTYFVSVLAAQPAKNTISKLTTLSDARDDGLVVTDYGYGYYGAEGNTTVAMNASNLNYQGATGWEELTDVNTALLELMPGFVFHSYRTYDPNTAGSKGLYPTGDPNGTMTLTETYNDQQISATFVVNPHFADALSVQSGGGLDTSKAPTDAPGAKNNPYGVRSVAQLELINWHRDNKNTKTTIDGANQNAIQRFPYLSSSSTTGKYYWLQSHDLDGGSKPYTYTPIAEYYDPTGGESGNLYGWFGGTYDGADYVIQNVNIVGQRASCAGLFGVVYGGSLKNVILHDTEGSGRIESGFDKNTKTRWYAIGALAGIAAKDPNGNGEVDSCAVSGYTITAKVYTSKGNGYDAWGGSCIGGLLGISRMDLNGCSAVTNIIVPQGTQDNDNMRIGGLVGVSQDTGDVTADYASIMNCYAGGKITIDSNIVFTKQNDSRTGNFSKGVYIGGLVGGSYMKPLYVNGNQNEKIGIMGDGREGNNGTNNTNNSLKNCYSFVELPSVGANPYIRALYAIGGTGDVYTKQEIMEVQKKTKAEHTLGNFGECKISNCYYLGDTVLANNKNGITKSRTPNDPLAFKTDIRVTNGIDYDSPIQDSNTPNPQVTSLTYPQLANNERVTKNGVTKYICPDPAKKITDAWLPDFAPVTNTEGGFSVAGKYSYAPSARKELQGIDYPFPTILTREGGAYHVHYGQWPKYGVVRPGHGGEPIVLDLFTGANHSETITLEGVTDNTNEWKVIPNEPLGIVNAYLNTYAATANSVTLTVNALKSGSTTLTIKKGDNEFTIVVNVITQLELRPNRLTMFANDSITVPMAAYGAAGDSPLSGPLSLASGGSSDGLTYAINGDQSVTFQSGATSVTQEEAANICYQYTHLGTVYEGSSAVTVTVIPQPAVTETTPGSVWTMDFRSSGAVIDNIAVSGGVATVQSDDNFVTITKKPDSQATEIKLVITLTMDGLEHTLNTTIPVTTTP